MGGLRAYPREAIHSLAYLSSLSDAPGITLFVSARTLYILQNLAVADATFSTRYATALLTGGYIPVSEEDAGNYALYESVVERLQLEVIEMPEVIDLLTDIKALLSAPLDTHPSAWDGSFWRKQLQQKTETLGVFDFVGTKEAAAGYDALASSVVPDGERWVAESVHALNANTALTYILLYVNFASAPHLFHYEPAPPAGRYAVWSGELTLDAGSTVVAAFYNCNAGDNLSLTIYGRRIGLEE